MGPVTGVAVAESHVWEPSFSLLRRALGGYAYWNLRFGLLLFPRAFLLEARAGGGLVGALVGEGSGDVGQVMALGVEPLFRRRGVGRALVEAALARWEREGVAKALTFIPRWNRPSWALFGGLGFSPERMRRFPYCLEWITPWGRHLALDLRDRARGGDLSLSGDRRANAIAGGMTHGRPR